MTPLCTLRTQSIGVGVKGLCTIAGIILVYYIRAQKAIIS